MKLSTTAQLVLILVGTVFSVWALTRTHKPIVDLADDDPDVIRFPNIAVTTWERNGTTIVLAVALLCGQAAAIVGLFWKD